MNALPGFDDALPTGVQRFTPSTYEHMLVAILTMWNILDANVNAAQLAGRGYTAPYGTPYGYMRPVQLHAYTRLVWRNSRARTYCEIGVNAGHGTAAMLLANPTLVAHSFDMGAYGYSEGAYRLLSLHFGERFQLHRGDSTRTVPDWAGSNQSVECDLLLVDGDHRYRGAYLDLVNMRQLASCNATVLIDDITLPPGKALDTAANEGLLTMVEKHVYGKRAPENPCLRAARPGSRRRSCDKRWGWAMASYAKPGRCGRTLS